MNIVSLKNGLNSDQTGNPAEWRDRCLAPGIRNCRVKQPKPPKSQPNEHLRKKRDTMGLRCPSEKKPVEHVFRKNKTQKRDPKFVRELKYTFLTTVSISVSFFFLTNPRIVSSLKMLPR